MVEADLDQVVVIERVFPAPWTRDMFLQELRHSQPGDARVAASGPLVLGYILCWFVADEVHVVNLAVHPEWRRRGLARALLADTFATALRRGMHLATLEVRVQNQPAVRLYEALDFRTVAVRKGYYADNGEDALVMVKTL
jgi:ribosomal-protein-alanine N-acetyltransferase